MVEWKSAEKETQLKVTDLKVSEPDHAAAPIVEVTENEGAGADLNIGQDSDSDANEASGIGKPTPKACLPEAGPAVKDKSIQKSNNDAKSNNDEDTPPDLGDRYEVLELIGSGGMGTVWKVHDRKLDEFFAIKVLRPELLADDTANKRFQREAKLASELTHTNIAAIFGPGFDAKDRPYIIMRYVDGESLSDILAREGKLSEERAIDIFTQVCEAMAHSHMKGIVHRDIKPSNIVISKTESGADLVQLVDFGIASCVYEERTKTQALTKAVDVFGSPRYMSPEQLLGEEVTQQSDIYSLGCVFYEMLTGKPPFTEENPVKLILQQMSEPVDLGPVPFRLRTLLYGCLAKEKILRLPSFDLVLKLIETVDSHLLANQPHDNILHGLFAAFLILISGLPLPAASLTLPVTLLLYGYTLMLNSTTAVCSLGYRKLELCLAVVSILLFPAFFLAPPLDRAHLGLLPAAIFVPFAAALAAWLTTNDKVLKYYTELKLRLSQHHNDRYRSWVRHGRWTQKMVNSHQVLLPIISFVPLGVISILLLPKLTESLSVGVPIYDIGTHSILTLSPIMFTAMCIGIVAIDSHYAQANIKKSILRSLRWSVYSYLGGLAAGATLLGFVQEPGMINYLRQADIPMELHVDEGKYKPARLAALNYPDTTMDNRARLEAAYTLGKSEDNVQSVVRLCDQIINSKCKNYPETVAQALDWKIYLTKDKADYNTVIAPQIDKALDLLDQVESSLKFPPEYAAKPELIALALARDARSFNDTERMERALAIAQKWEKGNDSLAAAIKELRAPPKTDWRYRGRMRDRYFY